MSTPIRPPGGPSPAGLTHGVESAAGVTPSKSAEIEETSAARRAAPAQAAGVESSTEVVLARLDAGEVTREQAIEHLVADALAQHGAGRLAPAQRNELQAVLRAALLDDPVLARLLG